MAKSESNCGAKTRAGNPCQLHCGWGTPHPGHGKCKLHGGSSPGAPAANKHALTTGEYETLHVSALSPQEQLLHVAVSVDPRAQAEAAIRLLSIREHRILLRIADVLTQDDPDGLLISSVTSHHGWNVKGKVDFSTTERPPLLDAVLRLEEALTRIQNMKARTIDQLRAILKDTHAEDSSGGLDAITAAIDRSARLLAGEAVGEAVGEASDE